MCKTIPENSFLVEKYSSAHVEKNVREVNKEFGNIIILNNPSFTRPICFLSTSLLISSSPVTQSNTSLVESVMIKFKIFKNEVKSEGFNFTLSEWKDGVK